MRTSANFFPVFFILVATGCQPSLRTPSGLSSVDIPNHSKFVFVLDNGSADIHVELDKPAYDGTNVANAMHQGAQSTANVPGVHPAAGLAGSLIGGAIVSGMAESSTRKKLDEPVAAFLDFAASSRLLNDSAYRIIKIDSADTIAPTPDTFRVTLSPNLFVTSDYRSLHLVSNIEIENASGDVIYNNIFEVYSAPQTGDTLQLASYWNFDGLVDGDKIIDGMLQALQQNFHQEINHWSKQHNNANSIGIKIQSTAGQHYERGNLLDDSGDTVTLRSLRGHVVRYLGAELN